MKEKRSKFNFSLITLAILVIGYVISVVNFAIVSRTTGSDSVEEGSTRIVRVAHWQLEPGYREGMQWAIDQYNNLPHVREAQVVVQQMGITERVYNQFMNVHLISGTAPDIAASGKTQLITGNNIAKFYTPLATYVEEPNPYNSADYLPENVSPELREFLSTAAWRETFIDGMEGGFNNELNDYYSIPVSSWGGSRKFYNMDLLREAKALIESGLAQQPRPAWLAGSLNESAGPDDFPVLPESEKLHQWLQSDELPETLGQLILSFEAVYQLSQLPGRDRLVGVSASSYFTNSLGSAYRTAFMNELGGNLDLMNTGIISALESLVGLVHGWWSFEDPAVVGFYEFAQRMVRYYPRGWLGLDREQAQRRFVLGSALTIHTGGWDASGIVRAVEERTDAFEVRIARPPVPGEGERYADYLPYLTSESEARLGVPLAINRQSRNFDWAMDFLQFLTSLPVNEEMNRQAGWVPAIVGAEIVEHMQPFDIDVQGLPGVRSVNLGGTSGRFRSVFSGSEPLLINQEITYDEFVALLMEALENPRLGLNDVWFRSRQQSNDQSRDRDRGLSIERAKALLDEDDLAAKRFPTLLYNNLISDEGFAIERFHHKLNPDSPFPARN